MEVEIGKEDQSRRVFLATIPRGQVSLYLTPSKNKEGQPYLDLKLAIDDPIPKTGDSFETGWWRFKKTYTLTNDAKPHFQRPSSSYPYDVIDEWTDHIQFKPPLQWGSWKILFDIEASVKTTLYGRVTYMAGMLVSEDVVAIYYQM